MSTTVFLVRHGSHDLLGKTLCGRMDGVHLNAAGVREAEAAARRLAREGLDAVYASPRQRCIETAAYIGAAVGGHAAPEQALDEIDFGDWTGRSFQELEADQAWRDWNSARAAHRPPGGESMGEARERMAAWLQRIRTRHPGRKVAAVGHADVIKAALADVLRLPLEHHHRFEISPGSVSVVVAGDWGLKVHSINEACA